VDIGIAIGRQRVRGVIGRDEDTAETGMQLLLELRH
jgi:hypothetical protein